MRGSEGKGMAGGGEACTKAWKCGLCLGRVDGRNAWDKVFFNREKMRLRGIGSGLPFSTGRKRAEQIRVHRRIVTSFPTL